MITRRAYLVVIVGFCFYLIALVNVLPSFYYALTWLMAGMLVSSMGLAIMSLSGLQCHWQPRRHLAQESVEEHDPVSSAPSISMEFANVGTLNKTGILVEISLQDIISQSTFKRSYLLEALTSGSSIASEISLLQIPRGEYELREIRLVGSDVLGLFRISRLVFQQEKGAEDTPSFVVGPAMIDVASNVEVPESATSWSGPGSTKWGQHSDEIRGIRAYAPGDDLRDVHWSSTARVGHLVVKEFARPLEQRVLVVWDGGLEFNRQRDALEWSLRFCASLVGFALENHVPCGLLCLQSEPVLLGGISQYGIPLTLETAQRSLARAQADRLTPLPESLLPYLSSAASYGQLYLVTFATNPETAAVLGAWRAAGGNAEALKIDINAFFSKDTAPSSRDFPAANIWPNNADISIASARKMLRRAVLGYAR